MKKLGSVIIMLFEILGIVSSFVFCVYICLTQQSGDVTRVMLALGFLVFAIIGITNLLYDRYREKHKKYKIVYLVDKENNNEINTNQH